jgi:tryptophanyl-tRNA synthetase
VRGTVLVLDDPDEVRRKFKAAVTDSGRDIVRRQDKAGVTNLIEIMAAARGIDPEQVENEFAQAPGYAGFKQDRGGGRVAGPRPRALRGAAGRGAGSQGCARQRRGEGAGDRLADP